MYPDTCTLGVCVGFRRSRPSCVCLASVLHVRFIRCSSLYTRNACCMWQRRLPRPRKPHAICHFTCQRVRREGLAVVWVGELLGMCQCFVCLRRLSRAVLEGRSRQDMGEVVHGTLIQTLRMTGKMPPRLVICMILVIYVDVNLTTL